MKTFLQTEPTVDSKFADKYEIKDIKETDDKNLTIFIDKAIGLHIVENESGDEVAFLYPFGQQDIDQEIERILDGNGLRKRDELSRAYPRILISKSNRYLVLVWSDKVAVVDIQKGLVLHRLDQLLEKVDLRFIHISLRGERIFWGGERTLGFNLFSGKKLFDKNLPSRHIECSPDGSRLLLKYGYCPPNTWSTYVSFEYLLLDASTGKTLAEFPSSFRAKFLSNDEIEREPSLIAESPRIELWHRRRPEWWYGIAYLPESWLTLLFALALLWSLRRDWQQFAAKTG